MNTLSPYSFEILVPMWIWVAVAYGKHDSLSITRARRPRKNWGDFCRFQEGHGEGGFS